MTNERKNGRWQSFLAACIALTALGCSGDGGENNGPPPPGTPQAVVLDSSNNLRKIRLDNGRSVGRAVAITGLQATETVLGVDFRPANGRLYGLGSTGRLYTIDVVTGAAAQVGTATFPGNLLGRVGFDFNPVADRIRVVTDRFQNFRLNPDDGTATSDTDLAYDPAGPNAAARPNVTGAAYTNNFVNAPNTTLYVLDADLNALAVQGGIGGNPSPNTGVLTVVGALGVDFTTAGFDVSGTTGTAFAALEIQGESNPALVAINLTNGFAQRVGRLDVGTEVRSLAVIP